jgi:NAD(P)-dependent dehydrogenase (short-subunit alcohol dehydrogenase family)
MASQPVSADNITSSVASPIICNRRDKQCGSDVSSGFDVAISVTFGGPPPSEGVHAAGLHESEFRKLLEAQTQPGRIGRPGDIAPTVVFLVSGDSGWITGETLLIAGGSR